MKSSTKLTHRLVILLGAFVWLLPSTCTKYNLKKNGVPQFVKHDFIDLGKVKRISKFRSGIGHDYSDRFESCRSMKHYFNMDTMNGQTPFDTANLYAPVSGKIVKIMAEYNGTQIWIESSYNRAFTFIIFHINPIKTFEKNAWINEGDMLGTSTNCDIAVMLNTWQGRKYISYFDVMTNELFNTYQQRGIATRDNLIISKETRDTNPLNCDGENFLGSPDANDWVLLK